MKYKQLIKAIDSSGYFKQLSSNNTYTLTALTSLNDPTVFCKPGGDRSFISVEFEHRNQELKASVRLIPQGTEYESYRSSALQLIKPQKKNKAQNYYITLINFNDLIRGLFAKDIGIESILECIAQELDYLKLNGQPSRTWSRQNNQITDWRVLFNVAQQAILDFSQAKDQTSDDPINSIESHSIESHSIESHLIESQSNSTLPVSAPSPTQHRSEQRFSRVLCLGSEFNANKGDLRTMDTITQEALRGGARSGETYFKIIKAQLESLKVDGSVYFDDVSIVPAGGKQSPKEVYIKNVELSKWFHRRLLNTYQPELIIIGGDQAMREYVKQVLDPNEYTAAKMPVIIQLRNPSQQAHWGSVDRTWLPAYQNTNVHKLLMEAMQAYPQHKHFQLVIPQNEGQWRVIPHT